MAQLCARLAQLVRSLTTNQNVLGSIPGLVEAWTLGDLFRDRVNAKIVHFYAKCFPKICLFEFVMRPWDANTETCSQRSSIMGPLQNFWWLETSKIMESQDSKQKYVARSLLFSPHRLWTAELSAHPHWAGVTRFWALSPAHPHGSRIHPVFQFFFFKIQSSHNLVLFHRQLNFPDGFPADFGSTSEIWWATMGKVYKAKGLCSFCTRCLNFRGWQL